MNEETRQNDGTGVSEETETAAPAPEARAAELTAEIEKLAVQNTDLWDQLLRARAEMDNFRRRAERERSEFVQFAGMETVRELVPVLDDFERALKTPCSDAEYARGVELIAQRLLESMKRTGLTPIESVGQTFDPHLHEAVQSVPTTEAEDHTVLEEYRRGYHFKGKLLRPAMVKVAVKPES